jgi:hypothetical protein
LYDARHGRAAASARETLAPVYGEPDCATERAAHDRSNRREQPRELRPRQRCRRRARVEARSPQRFRRVYVPDARDQPLIEKRRLDRSAAAGKGARQIARMQFWIGRLRPEPELQLTGGVAHIERGKRARIDEPDSRAVVELHDSPRKSRWRSRCAVHDPVARHTKVRMKGAPVLEVQELMLAATFDAIDANADE